MSSRPFVALPNEQVAWVAFHCGTMIWHDGFVDQHRRCAARAARIDAGRYMS